MPYRKDSVMSKSSCTKANRSASMAFDDAARNCAASYSIEYPHLWQIDWAFFSPKGRSAWVWLGYRQYAEETSVQIHRDEDGWFFRTKSNGEAVGGKVQPMFQRVALQ